MKITWIHWNSWKLCFLGNSCTIWCILYMNIRIKGKTFINIWNLTYKDTTNENAKAMSSFNYSCLHIKMMNHCHILATNNKPRLKYFIVQLLEQPTNWASFLLREPRIELLKISKSRKISREEHSYSIYLLLYYKCRLSRTCSKICPTCFDSHLTTIFFPFW